MPKARSTHSVARRQPYQVTTPSRRPRPSSHEQKPNSRQQTPQRTIPTLLTLPPELRQQIYEHLFTPDSTLTLQSWLPPMAAVSPSVLGIAAVTSTCRFLRAETLPVLHRRVCVAMPEGMRLLGDFRRRRTLDEEGRGGGGDAMMMMMGRVFDAARLRRVDVEVNPALIQEVKFAEVVGTFTAAREVRVKCLFCDRVEVDVERTKSGVVLRRLDDRTSGKDSKTGMSALERAVVLRETVEWVEQGMSNGDDEAATRWWDGVHVEVRMRLWTVGRDVRSRGGGGLWTDVGVICVGIGGHDMAKTVCLEVDGERLPVEMELEEGT